MTTFGQAQEWIGLRVLYRTEEHEPILIWFTRITYTEVRCGVVTEVTPGGYIHVKISEGYESSEWHALDEFSLLEVLPDDPEDETYKDTYRHLA